MLLCEGGATLPAGALEPVLTGALLTQICSIGYCLVLCIGLNFLAMAKIKTANLLPALVLPAAASFFIR